MFCTGSGFSQIEFKSDGTALLGGGSDFTYSLPDYSHIDFAGENRGKTRFL